MINTKHLTFEFKIDDSSLWLCPTCSHGHLVIDSDSFFSEETSISKEAKDYHEWEPEWVSYVYSCIFKCSNKSCNEVVASSGHGFNAFDIEVNSEGYEEQVYNSYYQPNYFHPPLKLIDLSKNIPEEIEQKLMKSFELFFCSPSSSANHARSAVEFVLTSLGVQRYVNKNGKRIKLPLHQRVEKLPKKYSDYQELLMAIKWLGNSGSHSEHEMTKNDVIELYEILEHVLSELFDNKTEKLKAKAKQINKDKGIKKR